MTEKELKKLLSEMSLEEKAGQLEQLPFGFFEDGNTVLTGPMGKISLTSEQIALTGSTLSGCGAAKLRRVQREYMENHPHHIPLLFMMDIINGCDTIFPIPLAQGAMFDPQRVKKAAQAAAREAAARGLHVTFSPMLDTVRDPRWGRVMESTGEDPYLNSENAKAMVKGYQGQDFGKTGVFARDSVAACIKHFAGYGAPLGGRDYNAVELSDRTLREDYLPAYKAAVDAGAQMVMTSFNTLDRVPSTANRWLFKELLRKEWGFEGVSITDWAAMAELMEHRVAADDREACRLAMDAGIDIDMCTGIYQFRLPELVKKGVISVKKLDEAVLRVLKLKNALGLFEDPYRGIDEDAEQEILLCDEHRKQARKAAEESFVLLKNEGGLLPLDPEKSGKVAFIGPFTDSGEVSGAWSILADPAKCVTIRQAAERKMKKFSLRFAEGSAFADAEDPIAGFDGPYIPDASGTEEELIAEAVEAAREADTVVMCIGEHRLMTGEASSRANIQIPAVQARLLRAVSGVNRNVVTVLFTGRPLDLREVSALSGALLVVWFPGTESGNAIVNTLTGKNNPSGKLPMSFPWCVGQVPVFYASFSTGRPVTDSNRDMKFLSRYMDIPNDPLYSFGFGLSYTSFSFSEVSLSGKSMKRRGGEKLTAGVRVTNTGDRAGECVVQMYIRDEVSSVARPVRELKGFKRITLEPGVSEEVTFEISEKMLRFIGIDGKRKSEPGEFTVYIGEDSSTMNGAGFALM